MEVPKEKERLVEVTVVAFTVVPVALVKTKDGNTPYPEAVTLVEEMLGAVRRVVMSALVAEAFVTSIRPPSNPVEAVIWVEETLAEVKRVTTSMLVEETFVRSPRADWR